MSRRANSILQSGFYLKKDFYLNVCLFIIKKIYLKKGKEAGPLYVAAFASSALIVLGLVHYLCCLVANYAHIKDGIKLRDYEEAIKEELELRCEMAASNRKRADL